MNQLHSDMQIESVAPARTYSVAGSTDSARLVVVIREAEEEALLAGRIQELARARGLPVLLVGIARDASAEATLRRSLVTIAAFLREANTVAGRSLRGSNAAMAPDIHVECGRDWLSKLRTLLRAGDMLACYSEEEAGVFERPLSDILSTRLRMPIYAFAGLRAEQGHRQSRLAQAASWAGSLASIGGFLVLQARIVTTIQGWPQSVLMLAALAAEVAVIWLVNSLIGQI